MKMECRTDGVKLETGIPGLDHISKGGLPRGRTTLVSGSAGSAKTVLAAQFLAEGIRRGEHGVFVTFEESGEDIRTNMASLSWDVAAWEADGKWAFVDASPTVEGQTQTGDFDLGALLARIEHAIRKVGAARVALDSLGSIFTQLPDTTPIRLELFRLLTALKGLEVTTLLTSERVSERGDADGFGFADFVADNVIVLRNTLSAGRRRRTIELVKLRGSDHRKGEFPFTVVPGEGIVIIPLSAMALTQRSTTARITSGNQALDVMCGGGFFRDSIILVTGATGCGKTLISTEFVAGGARSGQRTLLLGFEESADQLCRNATGWGSDFRQLEKDGRLRMVCAYPESASLEDHLIRIKSELERYEPDRLVVDSLTALERTSDEMGYREFIVALTSFVKTSGTAGLFTAASPTLMGGVSVTEAQISTITDSIVLLRYVEMYGEMRRGLLVLKMRGSEHDKQIREFTIDGRGLHIGHAFRGVTGIVSGRPQYSGPAEMDRVSALFQTSPAVPEGSPP